MNVQSPNQKISIISPSLNGGGAEKVAVNLANFYVSTGYDVDLVLLKRVGPYQTLVSESVNVVDLKVTRNRYSFSKLRQYFKENPDSMVLSVIRDVNIFVGLAAISVPLRSITFREANVLGPDFHRINPRMFFYRILMKFAYRRADNVIANSHDTKRDILKNKIASDRNIFVIRNPVLSPDYERLTNEAVDEDWFNRNNLKVILSVGRLHPQKNFPFLISAFNSVKMKCEDARLMIVGEGDERDSILRQIRKLGLSDVVKVVGFKNNIYPYYDNANVFALSSSWEGFGNVLVEALSAGLPVVSTNCPGGPKMILKNGEFGKLIPLGDKESYVDALLEALKTPSRNKDSMLYAKNFTVEVVAKEYLRVLNLQEMVSHKRE